MISRINTQSVEYTGNTSFPFNQDRNYLFVVVTAGSATIEFGDGGGKIPLAEGFHYEPYVCPISAITIESIGTYIVHMG